jgi:F-type H+-transporting ATPase subunit delta
MPDTSDTAARDARATARADADVGVEHIADVYAQALLDAAARAGPAAIAEAVGDLDVVDELLDGFPKLHAVLASALILPEEKSALIERLLAGRVAPLVVHFLEVVARHGRLDCLRAIGRQAHVLWDRRRNRVRVELTTAVPLDPEMARQIVDGLRGKLGGEPVLEQKTDPELIGGAVLRIGDVVYDGSIANQLRNLREKVHQRSAHEIQSRRDRFRNSAGN